VRVNRATARALSGRGAEAESLLARLTDAEGPAGTTAAYNLGTLEAKGNRYDEALASLRHALERDPTDDDARYNYELALRRQQEKKRGGGASQSPSPAQPQPQAQGQQPTPSSPSPTPNAPQAPQAQGTPPPRQGPGQMNRATAEQLLGSLSELERLEQQRLRKVRVVREKRGRDW
jgi:tetratricopeptide (TPR) repeat protein